MRLLQILQQRNDLEKKILENNATLETLNEKKLENYSRLITDEEALTIVINQIKKITSKRQSLETGIEHGRQKEKHFKEEVDLLEKIDQEYRDKLRKINRNPNNKRILKFLEHNVEELHSKVNGVDDSRILSGNERFFEHIHEFANNECLMKMTKTFVQNSEEKEVHEEYNQQMFSDDITLEIRKSTVEGNFKRKCKNKQKLKVAH